MPRNSIADEERKNANSQAQGQQALVGVGTPYLVLEIVIIRITVGLGCFLGLFEGLPGDEDGSRSVLLPRPGNGRTGLSSAALHLTLAVPP